MPLALSPGTRSHARPPTCGSTQPARYLVRRAEYGDLARQGAAGTSVCVKSFPLNKSGNPVAFANA